MNRHPSHGAQKLTRYTAAALQQRFFPIARRTQHQADLVFWVHETSDKLVFAFPGFCVGMATHEQVELRLRTAQVRRQPVNVFVQMLLHYLVLYRLQTQVTNAQGEGFITNRKGTGLIGQLVGAQVPDTFDDE